jgi:DNA modification methylase
LYEYEIKKVSDLLPYVNNSRTHSEEQITQIASSISEFGFTNPVLVDETNNLIAGHGRLLAAKKLGIEEVPAIILRGLTKAQKKAYVIADNQLALNAGWDLDMLKLEIEGLNELDFDINLLGFDDDFLDGLLEEQPVEGLTDEDEVPEPPETPVSVLGDIWQLGNHRLMCGSSTEAHAVDLLIDGQEPNTMITDPPYGVNYDAGWRAEAKGTKKTEREDTSTIQNDNQSDWYDAYSLFTGNVAYVWHASAFTDVVMDGLKRAGFEIKAQIIWNKNVHALSRSDYQWKHEPCWYAIKKGANHNWVGDRKQKTIWDVQNVMFEKDAGGKTSHPTQKPVELYIRSINNNTNSGEYVYEPFGGSGTGIIAAEKTNRRSLTMELDEKFVDVIINRWQSYTGKEAIHIESGKTYKELKDDQPS